MAKYNRDFLVPYLNDVCALHLARMKVEKKAAALTSRREMLHADVMRLKAPQTPLYDDTGKWIVFIVVGVICIVVSFLDILIISFLAGLAGWFVTIPSVIWLFKAKSNNDEKERHYNAEYWNYSYQFDRRKKAYDDFGAKFVAEYNLCVIEADRIDAVLKKVYAANVIPRRYRDAYVAVYLYDWFSTGMSDDLDMALNMYVLEEIKERLDRIIHMLSENLLNQRITIANQEKAIAQQEQYRIEMIGKMNQLQLNAEEQTRYMGMIESNTATTTYFATAEYMRKL